MEQTDRHASDLGAAEHRDEKPGSPPRPATEPGGGGAASGKTRTDPATGEDKGHPKGSEKV